MRKTGLVLILLAYALLLFTTLAAPAYAHAHPGLGDPAMLAQYAGPWPVALGCSTSLAGVVLTLIPIRRGEAWARWTSFAMLMILFLERLAKDPRCLVVLDPHQHGCHTFMIAIVLGATGLVMARGPRSA